MRHLREIRGTFGCCTTVVRLGIVKSASRGRLFSLCALSLFFPLSSQFCHLECRSAEMCGGQRCSDQASDEKKRDNAKGCPERRISPSPANGLFSHGDSTRPHRLAVSHANEISSKVGHFGI